MAAGRPFGSAICWCGAAYLMPAFYLMPALLQAVLNFAVQSTFAVT